VNGKQEAKGKSKVKSQKAKVKSVPDEYSAAPLGGAAASRSESVR
jgi:hypothetical protein